MFEVLERTTETCIGVKVSGKVQAGDYSKVRPLLSNAIKAHGTINLVVLFEDLEGIADADVIREDVTAALQDLGDIAKVAIIGTEDWQEWAAKLMGPLTLGTKEKYFSLDEIDDAWTWACGMDWQE